MRANLLKLSNLLLLLCAFGAHAAEGLTDASNLQQLGKDNPNEVIVLMISQENCGFCSRVKEEYPKPLMKSANHPPLRILQLDRSDKVVDFNGEARSGSIIASRLGGRFTPTLLFVDSDGTPIHEPIVGLTTPEYYGYYLDEAIADSRKRLKQ